MDTFTFSIQIPGAPDTLELLDALSGQMSRYIGLSSESAPQAGAVVNRLVADRLSRAGGPVQVVFTRPHGAAPVSVEIVSPAVAADRTSLSPGGGVAIETDGRQTRLRLSWSVANGR